jgi:hypothetical protein
MTNLEIVEMLHRDIVLFQHLIDGKTPTVALRDVAPEIVRHLTLAAEALEVHSGM